MESMFTVINSTDMQYSETGPEKIQACMGFEIITSAITVQCSTNWANKPSLGAGHYVDL